MSLIEKNPTQRVDQQNIEDDQRSESSEDSPSTSLTPGSHRRTLMWILKILIVLFVLNRNLNKSLAADGAQRPGLQMVTTECGKQFDYFALNMIWPTTICGKVLALGTKDPNKCLKNLKAFLTYRQDKFTIHGLWPSDTSLAVGRGPIDCWKKRDYDITRESTRLRYLNSYWPSFIKDNQNFWNSEWEKHGRCAANVPLIQNSYAYFSVTMNLAIALDDLQRKLRERHPELTRGAEALLNFQAFRQFIAKEVGADVVINYQKFEMKGIPEYWVEALIFCYDVQFNRIACPIKKENSFVGTVVLPTIPSLGRVEVKPRI